MRNRMSQLIVLGVYLAVDDDAQFDMTLALMLRMNRVRHGRSR